MGRGSGPPPRAYNYSCACSAAVRARSSYSSCPRALTLALQSFAERKVHVVTAEDSWHRVFRARLDNECSWFALKEFTD